jgi:site-specific recombinase XerD
MVAGYAFLKLCACTFKYVGFEYQQITVRLGKGDKDRVTPFSASLNALMRNYLAKIEVIHNQDFQASLGSVYLPHALEKKYISAATSWNWQYVFPARQRSIDLCNNLCAATSY